MMEEIYLDSKYLVYDDGTSDGTQDKYFKDGIWYKVDRYGGEGYNEELSSKLLSCTDLHLDEFVNYQQVIINGKMGCKSNSFLQGHEEYVSIYRLHKNVTGIDIATVFSNMDFEDQADYIVSFVSKETGLNIEKMLGNIFFVDKLILNDDRHFNNIGLIFDGDSFREAPIFDNGKSFFCGNKSYNLKRGYQQNLRSVRFKPFITSIGMMQQRFPSDININWDRMNCFLNEIQLELHKTILLQQLKPILDQDCNVKTNSKRSFEDIYDFYEIGAFSEEE